MMMIICMNRLSTTMYVKCPQLNAQINHDMKFLATCRCHQSMIDVSYESCATTYCCPRDPDSGFPVGGTALFINSLELRSPPVTLPVLGEGWGFAIFHDMGNVYTAGHDMVKGFLRWHQPDPGNCVQSDGSLNSGCLNFFNNSGFDYTSHAVGMGVRYKTPIGPLRFDFGYNLNPTEYLQKTGTTSTGLPIFGRQRLGPFNVFFSIGQPF